MRGRASFGYRGRSAACRPGAGAAGHEVLGVELGDAVPPGADAAVDFTQPDAVVGNVERCLELGVPSSSARPAGRPSASGSTGGAGAGGAGLRRAELLDRRGADDALRRRGGAGTSRGRRSSSCTTRRRRTRPRAPPRRPRRRSAATRRSTRSGCPGSSRTRRCSSPATGELLTIRHDTLSRESFVPGVLLALERLRDAPAGPDGWPGQLSLSTHPACSARS